MYQEGRAIAKDNLRDCGLGKLSSRTLLLEAERGQLVEGVFDGLAEYCRSCMECRYTEAVMHFPFDDWQLSMSALQYVNRFDGFPSDMQSTLTTRRRWC